MKFYSFLGTRPFVPDIREIAWDTNTNTIVERTWAGSGTAPSTTWAASPTTSTLLTDVKPTFLSGTSGLPHALSGHLTYYFWKPPHVDTAQVLAVGFDYDFLAAHFGSVVQVGNLSNHDGIRNQEYGRKIYLCTLPRNSLDAMWPGFKQFR